MITKCYDTFTSYVRTSLNVKETAELWREAITLAVIYKRFRDVKTYVWGYIKRKLNKTATKPKGWSKLLLYSVKHSIKTQPWTTPSQNQLTSFDDL